MGGPMAPAGMNPMNPMGGAPAGGQPPGSILELLFRPEILILVLGLMFYFTVLRPQQTRQSEHDKMLSELKPNDRVYTIGGILGTIVDIDKDSNTMTLRIDEKSGARIEVRRGYIGGLASDEDEDDDKKKDG
jgi:preprotein translocase subunit YajC